MNKKKNFCIISYDLISGGSELNAKKIINHIDNNYFWVSLGNKDKKKILKINKLKKKIFLNFKISNFFNILRNLNTFIRKNKITIIYAIGMYPSLLASILKFQHKFKLIITRRGVINKLNMIKYFFIFAFIYFRADKIETNSRSIFIKFKRSIFFNKKIYLINNLVEKKIFKGSYKRIVEKKTIILGFAMNIRPVKDPILIKKIIEIVCNNTDYKFLIVGRDNNNFWKELSSKYKKRLIWLDTLNYEKMINFYKSIDFLLMTSKSEGSPNTIVEALSNGVPTVSVPIEANDGLIIDNYNGIISINRSPEEFFNAILKAEKFKKKLSKNSKFFFKKNFDLGKNIKKLKVHF